MAAEKGSLELARKLLDFNIQINAQDKWGATALFYAVNPQCRDNIKLVSLFFDRGADPNITCNNGMTPLLKAVERGSLRVAELLLSKGSKAFIKLAETGKEINKTL